jgi:hypothetical protein
VTPADQRHPPGWVRLLLLAAVVAPIAVAVWRAMRADWFPIGDSALLYIRARDVLTAHHPFLGSWTSASLSVGEHMNNPGSMYDHLLLPWSRVFRFPSAAALAVGIVNGATIVGIVAAARSIGGWAAQRWALLATAGLAWVMGSELLIDIWQAHALLFPFLALLVLAVGLAVERWHLLPWAAAVATLLLQTHISYVYVIGVVGLSALAVLLVNRRGSVPWGAWRDAGTSRPVVLTAAVLLVLWAQPVWEQLFAPGKGNLSRLAGNASGGDLQLGLADGTRFAAEILSQPLWRLRSGFSSLIPPLPLTQAPDGPAIVVTGIIGTAAAVVVVLAMVALLAGAGWVAHRRANRVGAAACWIAAGTVLGTPLCLASVTVGLVGLSQHHLRWLWTVGVFVNVVVAWIVVDLAGRRLRSRATDLLPVGLGLLLAALAVPYLAQQQGPVADEEAVPALRRVLRDLDRLEPLAPVLFDIRNLRVFEPYSSTVMLRLQELDIDFRVDDEVWVRQLGERRRASGRERATIFQLERVAALTYRGPACLVSRASAVDPEEERRVERLVDRLAARLAAGGVAEDDARRAVLEGPALGGVPGADAADLAAIERWVDSTYALFVDAPGPCPS